MFKRIRYRGKVLNAMNQTLMPLGMTLMVKTYGPAATITIKGLIEHGFERDIPIDECADMLVSTLIDFWGDSH